MGEITLFASNTIGVATAENMSDLKVFRGHADLPFFALVPRGLLRSRIQIRIQFRSLEFYIGVIWPLAICARLGLVERNHQLKPNFQCTDPPWSYRVGGA